MKKALTLLTVLALTIVSGFAQGIASIPSVIDYNTENYFDLENGIQNEVLAISDQYSYNDQQLSENVNKAPANQVAVLIDDTPTSPRNAETYSGTKITIPHKKKDEKPKE